MTTSAAENRARVTGDKEKVEKRRAFGGGLGSLLPGTRVLSGGQESYRGGRAAELPANSRFLTSFGMTRVPLLTGRWRIMGRFRPKRLGEMGPRSLRRQLRDSLLWRFRR